MRVLLHTHALDPVLVQLIFIITSPYFTEEVNPNLVKPSLDFNGGLNKYWLTS